MVADKIDEIEREVQKLENQLTELKKKQPSSKRDRKMHEARVSLLQDVVTDLRRQQKRIQQNSKDQA